MYRERDIDVHIYIRRASGPRRGEITVFIVVCRGFNPSPYPSPGRSRCQKLVSCGFAVASLCSADGWRSVLEPSRAVPNPYPNSNPYPNPYP